jgi:hypothetical protein
MATDTNAIMEGTVVFYGVWSGTTMWKCFLWGPIPGYITKDTIGRKVTLMGLETRTC